MDGRTKQNEGLKELTESGQALGPQDAQGSGVGTTDHTPPHQLPGVRAWGHVAGPRGREKAPPLSHGCGAIHIPVGRVTGPAAAEWVRG